MLQDSGSMQCCCSTEGATDQARKRIEAGERYQIQRVSGAVLLCGHRFVTVGLDALWLPRARKSEHNLVMQPISWHTVGMGGNYSEMQLPKEMLMMRS